MLSAWGKLLMNQVIIRSRNPSDISLDEAEQLARAIRVLLPDDNVQVEGKERREGSKGITWFQIIEIMLPAGLIVGKEVIQELTKIGIEWARTRFKARGGRRPVYIPIYGPDGKVVKSVVVKNAVDEPEDRTEQDRKRFE
jgi:hypothetical protein